MKTAVEYVFPEIADPKARGFSEGIEAAKGKVAGLINQAERENSKLAANWLRKALLEIHTLLHEHKM